MQHVGRMTIALIIVTALLLASFALGIGVISSNPVHANADPASVLSPDTTWTEAKLVAPTPVSGAQFGTSLAVDGANVLIGVPVDNGANGNSGAAYLAEFNAGVWSTPLKLTASDGEASDAFGSDVAFGADYLVIGARGHDAAGGNSGAVYVFRNNGSGWSEKVKLLPDIGGDTFFGHTVAADGNRIAVGAPYSDSGTTNSGSVYVFEYDGSVWQKIARLTSGSQGGAVLSDLFGWSVDIQGDTLVVGAYLDNTVYRYTFANDQWTLAGEINGADVQAGDQYGYSVALDGATLVVGAPAHNAAGNNAGAIYVFEDNGSGWSEQAKFTPSDGLTGSRLGWSVAVRGSMIAAGARESKGLDDREESGSVYVYNKGDSGWSQSIQLGANDAAAMDHFGHSVGVGPTSVLAGAPDNDNRSETNNGAVYAYLKSDTTPPTPTATPDPSETPDPDPSPSPAPPTPTPTETPASEPSDDCDAMAAIEASTDELESGATITWESSFHCVNADDEGTYALTMTISYNGAATSSIELDDLQLTHTTPRPQGQSPEATVELPTFPINIPAGGSETILVRGDYKLVTTGAIKHANLHFCLTGVEQESEDAFALGFSAHLRGNRAQPPVGANDLSAPPVIANLSAIVHSHSMRLVWQSDQPTNAQVTVETDPLSSPPRKFAPGCGARSNHSIRVNGLHSNMDYVVRVSARNEEGTAAESGVLRVRTGRAAVNVFLPSIAR